MRAVFGLTDPLTSMSPVHIPRGFTKAYIAGEVVEDLGARIRLAARDFVDHDVLLIEGTGHAGVGAVIGLSNAAVAAMLGAPAVIVSARAASAGRSTRSSSTPRSFAATASRSPGRSSTRSTSTPSRASSGCSSAGSPTTASRCSACCRTGRSCRTRRSGMVLEGVRGETLHPGPDLDRGHRRRGDRGDGARPHARAGRAADARHRARRPRGRDPHPDDGPLVGPPGGRPWQGRRAGRHARRPAVGRRRGGRWPRGRRARARPDRRLPAPAGDHRRDPPGGPVRDARRRRTPTRSPPRSTTSS